MGIVKMNGVTYNGNSISMRGNKIIIDGVDVTGDHEDAKKINVIVEGDINSFDIDYAEKIAVAGNVTDLKTMSGSVEVRGDVHGDVKTQSGSVKIEGNVDGNVKTMSGSVKSGDVGGKINTMSGSVKHR